MKIISGQNIATSIKDICPKKIAVAFIGADYSSFLDDSCIKKLECVILSPTEGSNPRAILDLSKKIGWSKIFFLDRLHAKIYIGDNSSIIGSSNLSRNGLIGDESGLYEVCIKVDANEQIVKLFNDILSKAKKDYPDEISKQNALDSLFCIYNRRKSIGLEMTKNESLDFSLYDWENGEHFYISWYSGRSDDCGNTEKTERIYGSDIEKEYGEEQSMAFEEDDDIKKNKWILCWKCHNNENKIDQRKKLSWVYIDDIVSEGWYDGKDSPYTKLAVQLKSLSQNRPNPPFKITTEFTEAFKKVIDKKVYEILFNDPYKASSTDIAKIMPRFLNEVKKQMQNNS
ncbi:MAG: phospholipase D family protein [Fibrobacter sp.]|nr:phospholipase D family protein [Fibrobacter sp.]